MHKTFCALVREARQKHHLDQDEFGMLLGWDDATVSKVENGHRPLYADELLALALIFEDEVEVDIETYVEDITADIAARLREYLDDTTFTVDQLGKQEWLQSVLARLDGSDREIIEA